MTDVEQILDGLNDAQREAVTAVSGPVAIIAGAGTGKTRVVSHRAAYAIASGAVDPRHVLLVTFTTKAAGEMAERMRSLGFPAVAARTFHSAALAQLRYFWSLRHPDSPLPGILADKWRLVAPLARTLPGGYRFTPVKDLVDTIDWAKARRIGPDAYAAAGREPPIPVDLFVRVYRRYEQAKARQGLIDFDDMLALTVDMIESDEDAARLVRNRYRWFTVDEFQDTTPLQYRLLELWLGDRRDACVVGDDDQTIYTFAGASPSHLRDFADRFPGTRVIALVENYRSSPQVLDLANRLLASTGRPKRLVATHPPGPEPSLAGLPDGEAEVRHVVDRIRDLVVEGVPAHEVAVLVRMNAQLADFESALTRERIPYTVVGARFFERREVREAIRLLRGLSADLAADHLVAAAEAAWHKGLGFGDDDASVRGAEARERRAALETLLGIVRDVALAPGAAGGRPGLAEVLADLEARSAGEQASDGSGVNLLTLHRAKGLEWEAVFLPSLEEGILPVAQAVDDAEAIDEERRLLYVGITRARRHLWLTWAAQRTSATTGRPQQRRRSRFLAPLLSSPPGRAATTRWVGPRTTRDRSEPPAGTSAASPGDPDVEALIDALREWRRGRARDDGVPAYVICHDATLRAIAEQRPGSPEDLLQVPGIGPAKLERYGSEILALVAARTP